MATKPISLRDRYSIKDTIKEVLFAWPGVRGVRGLLGVRGVPMLFDLGARGAELELSTGVSISSTLTS